MYILYPYLSFCLTKTGRFNALLAWQWTGAGPRACRSCLSTHGSLRGPHGSGDRHPGCDAPTPAVGAGPLPVWVLPSSCYGEAGLTTHSYCLGLPSLDFTQSPCYPSPVSPWPHSAIQLTSYRVLVPFTWNRTLVPRIRFWHPSLLDGMSMALRGHPGLKEPLADPQREPLVSLRGDSCCVHVLTELPDTDAPPSHPQTASS